MIQQQLYEWITHPERLNRDTLYELRTLLARYPYFQTVRLLYLKNLFLLHDITFGEELRKAALYVADRKILFYLMEGERFTVSVSYTHLFYSLPWKGNFWWKAFLYFYGNYTRQQERMTPNFQLFYALVKEKYGDNIPQELRDEFRAASKPLMKYTHILTFNTRAIALYISLLIGEPWLYFVFEVVVMTSLFEMCIRDSSSAL